MTAPTEPGVARTCSPPECDTDGTGEPNDRHEREQAHQEGEHELCGTGCEVAFPTDMLRNSLTATAAPGAKDILAELERRAATPNPAPPGDDLRQAIADAIGPTMHLGLQDADLWGAGGTERIGEWVEWIADAVLPLLAARDAQTRAQALREAADAVAADTGHIRYGSATDYAERHAALLRARADGIHRSGS